MPETLRGVLTVAGRAMLCCIFFMSAVGNKIPNFNGVVKYMQGEGVPAANLLLVGAILFMIAGSLMILLGFKARIGAVLLATFLVLATYYFHDFWNVPADQQQAQTIQFMKNLSMLGAMFFIMANGSGMWSLDHYLASKAARSESPEQAA